MAFFGTSYCPRSHWTSPIVSTSPAGGFLCNRGLSSYLKLGGQLVMRRAAAVRRRLLFWKVWGGNCPPCPPFIEAPECMMGLSAILEWTFDYRWMTNDVRPKRPTATTSSPLIPGLWAASPAVWGCAADGRGLWDESYVASCVHDLHIQAAAANQSHFIDVTR